MALKNNDAYTKACWIGETPTLTAEKATHEKARRQADIPLSQLS
jgi:hypothetical protein